MGIEKENNILKIVIGYVIGFLLSASVYINPVFHLFVVINIFLLRGKYKTNKIIQNIFRALLTSYLVTFIFVYLTLSFTVIGHFSR